MKLHDQGLFKNVYFATGFCQKKTYIFAKDRGIINYEFVKKLRPVTLRQ